MPLGFSQSQALIVKQRHLLQHCTTNNSKKNTSKLKCFGNMKRWNVVGYLIGVLNVCWNDWWCLLNCTQKYHNFFLFSPNKVACSVALCSFKDSLIRKNDRNGKKYQKYEISSFYMAIKIISINTWNLQHSVIAAGVISFPL